MLPFLPLLALALLPAPAAARAETITVAWRDKPPHHYLEGGVEKGYLLEQARREFKAAGVEARFVREPAKRIWANFEGGARNYCSIGWYKLPERERVAQFSVPIHTDPPHIVLASREATHVIDAHATLAALLADATLSIGLVDGVSYGPQLDVLVRASRNQQVRRTVEPMAMMRMVAAGRVSFMLMDREDWDFARQHDERLAGLDVNVFPDMPAGLQRYIACSKDVPAATMERLNRAIEAVTGSGRTGRPGGR
ncbi:MAG: transporter substrate-binding domain-containing protein [Telluria sp.]